MGLYPGGLISGIINSFENGWAYIRGKLKTGVGLKVGFYGTNHTVCYGNHGYSHSVECHPYNLAHRLRFSHRRTDRHKRSVKYNFLHAYFFIRTSTFLPRFVVLTFLHNLSLNCS